MVQYFSDFYSDWHEVVVSRRQNMYGRDDFALRKLPDMELVQIQNAFHCEDRFSYFFQGDCRWHTLQKDERCAPD